MVLARAMKRKESYIATHDMAFSFQIKRPDHNANHYLILVQIYKTNALIQKNNDKIWQTNSLLNSYELNDEIVKLALNDTNFKDFEDGLQHYTALESQCDLIITRNTKDFKKSAITVLSPKEYLTKIKVER